MEKEKRVVIERAEIKLGDMVGIETKLHHLRRYQFASQYLKKIDMVLDLCCGTGYGSAVMAKCAEVVHGIEINLEAVEYARQNNQAPNIKFHCADITELDDSGRYDYDVVTMFECLDHLPKEDGIRIVNLIGERCKSMFFASLPENQLIGINDFHIAEWNIEELKGILEKYFSRVVIFGQAWNSGVISFPYDERRALSVIVAIK